MKLSRFNILEKLGQGGTGIVYRAEDTERRAEVALKTLSNLQPAALQRFKQEFRSITNVSHPNLVTLYELFFENENWFFTMEHIEGFDFYDAVYLEKAESLLSADTTAPSLSNGVQRRVKLLETLLPQVLSGLSHLHQNGIIHRDLKPSNIMLSKEGRVVILDFGIAITKHFEPSKETLETTISGTLEYLPPEAIQGTKPIPESDYYSLGAMIYETLTGALPFTGEVAEILYQKVKTPPRPPTELVPEIPEKWNDICMSLLRIDPSLRPDAKDLLQVLGENNGTKPAASVHFESMKEVFVGREDELTLLRQSFDSLSAPLLIGGRSGVGKSMLVDKFLQKLRTCEGMLVLEGRCYEQEMVPFKAFDSVIDCLARKLSRLSDCRFLIPGDIRALLTVFPVLGRVEQFLEAARFEPQIPDKIELNRRATSALLELLQRLSDRYTITVFIDNLQWGDRDSAGLLHRLLQGTRGRNLFFLGTFRVEDERASIFFRTFRRLIEQQGPKDYIKRHVIEPLSDKDTVKLAKVLLENGHRTDRELAHGLAQESQGNPFFLREMTRYALYQNSTASTEINLNLLDVLWKRISQLNQEAQHLLAVISTAGHPISEGLAARAAGSSDSLPALVALLRAENLIRTIGTGETLELETYHDKVRESVLTHLAPSLLSTLHSKLAKVLVETCGASPREVQLQVDTLIKSRKAGLSTYSNNKELRNLHQISFHYFSAKDYKNALPWALLAAAQARAISSLEAARQQLEIAEKCSAGANRATLFYIALEYGDILTLLGSYHDAEQHYRQACDWAESRLEKAATEAKLAELIRRYGKIEDARKLLLSALSLLGTRIPKHSWSIAAHILYEAAILFLRSSIPWLSFRRKQTPASEEQLLHIRLMSLGGHIYWFYNIMQCLHFHLRNINLAERHPPSVELARAYAEHGPCCGLVGLNKRGIRYVRKAVAINRSLNSHTGEAHASAFLAFTYLRFSRFEESIATAEEAVSIIARAGDPWDMHVAKYQMGYSYYCLGNLERAQEIGSALQRSALAVGDALAVCFALDMWAKAARGDIPLDCITSQLPGPEGDFQAQNELFQARGLYWLHHGEIEAAIEDFREALRIPREAGAVNHFCTPAASWLATCLRLRAVQLMENDRNEFRKSLKQLARAVNRAVLISHFFKNDLAHAQREAGILAFLTNRPRKARKKLEQSIATAQKMKMKTEAQLSRNILKSLFEEQNSPSTTSKTPDKISALYLW